MSQTPSIEKLFLGQAEEHVKELMESIDQSKHRKEILDKILRQEHMLFNVVEKNKPEILSVVLEKLNPAEKEDFVNLVRNTADGDTALHLVVRSKKSPKTASLLLEAGAKFVTNAGGFTPAIEDFFTEENVDQITTALVDGLVERVKTKQLFQKEALKLLIPVDKKGKNLFQRATRSNWGVIAEWMDVDEFNQHFFKWMLDEFNESRWTKEDVGNLVCRTNMYNQLILATLDEETQKKLAMINKESTKQ